MSTNRTYIGDPIPMSDGNTLSVYVENWANEAPDTVALDGLACLLFFDPGTRAGRDAITDLISRLQSALTRHDVDIAEIYSNLRPGSDPARIRLAADHETRCPHLLDGQQCERVDHVDRFHVTIENTARTYAVRSVWCSS